ncbi:MAG: flagellar motor protein MotB [Vulcanimicrobiota bacterium]
MSDFDGPPIIVKKIVKGGHGHHGGSWKVAYADFVTAMMALFIVLWVIGQSDPVKQAVSEYFIDPSLSPEEIAIKLSRAKAEAEEIKPEPMLEPQEDKPDEEMVDLADRIRNALEALDWEDKLEGQIIIELTDEGLRIELIDLATSPFFDIGSALPKPHTQQALRAIGKQLANSDKPIALEGHTDSRPFHNGYYGNWELSADRANAARRLLEEAGVSASRIQAVRGYADQRLRDKKNPMSASNRRVSIVVFHKKQPGSKKKPPREKHDESHSEDIHPSERHASTGPHED